VVKIIPFAIGLGCVFGISVGQILFKLGAETNTSEEGVNLIIRLMTNRYTLCAVILYVVTTIFWVYLLRLVPLKELYPLMALAYVFVPILAKVFLNEDLELKSIIGALIIIVGVYVSVR